MTASCDELDFVLLLCALSQRHEWASAALLGRDHTIEVGPESLRLLSLQITGTICSLRVIQHLISLTTV